MPMYSHVLAAVDLGPDSEALMHKAVEVAQLFDARLSLVHVVEYVMAEPAGETLMPPPLSLEPELVKGAERQLAELAARTGAGKAQRQVAIGSIGTELSRLVQDLGADLVVTGAHERHGLAFLLASGTERSLLKHAKSDLLIVRL